MQTRMIAPAGPGAALRYVPFGRTSTVREIDWSAAPVRYKRYPDAERFLLRWDPVEQHGGGLGRLLRELYGHAGVRWSLSVPAHVTMTRTVPSGGALYPLSIYLATGSNQEVPPGLYHYDAAHHALELLRAGDHRPALATWLTGRPDDDPSLIVVIATRFWRNAFKYREFGYRLQTQEIGVLTAQALALAEVMSLSASVHLNIADERINQLIGLETFRESAMAVLDFTQPGTTAPDATRALSYDELVAMPVPVAADQLRDIRTTLPATAALHAASLPEPAPSEPYRIAMSRQPGQLRVPLPAVQIRLADGIPGRASAVNGFAPTSLNLHDVAMVLDAAATGYPSDLPATRDRPVGTVPYCLLLRVDGVVPGAYRHVPEENALVPIGTPESLCRLLTEGRLSVLTRLALNEAGMALIPVGDYESGVRSHGDRWYRLQNIEAGIMVHRATLAATAAGLTARIFSDGTRDTVDDALGLTATPNQSLSMLLVGHRRPSPMVLDLG